MKANAILEGFVKVHAACHTGARRASLIWGGGSHRISVALHSIVTFALRNPPQVSKKLGIALAGAIATNSFDESGMGLGSYVPRNDLDDDEDAPWAAIKVQLARQGWGYLGHGEYGETGGLAPEDCEGGYGLDDDSD